MQYFALITVELPGRSAATLSSLITVTGQTTRLDLYNYMRGEVVQNYGEQFADATTVYFTCEPNTIGT